MRDKANRRSGSGFSDLGIIRTLMNGINRLNFEMPTPIQKRSIPAGIQGDDIIAIARTGSGKTLAYGIPMLQRLSKSNKGTGLIVVPTRELAIQVEESLKDIGRSLNIRTVVLIGGVAMSLQRNILKKNPRIIIATPGRMLDHIKRRTVNLSNTEILVLDEADRMLDMGFIPDIKKIVTSVPDKRQTMLFSATMPKEIENIAGQLMEDPVRIEVDRSGVIPSEISHEMFIVNNKDKSRFLAVRLRNCSGPVLVFTRTKWMARKLTAKIKKMGFDTAEIHSNRSLLQRRQALEGFKQGKYQVLIATDIAARGIDVSGIELVVNYDMPANSEDYVHRIGRTGRAGKIGHAVSFATSDQKSAIRNLERFMKTKLTVSTPPIFSSIEHTSEEGDRSKVEDKPLKNGKFPKRKPSRNRSSTRLRLKHAKSKAKKSRSAASRRSESSDGNAFGPNFKKNWRTEKKTTGQEPRRKKRHKRKNN